MAFKQFETEVEMFWWNISEEELWNLSVEELQLHKDDIIDYELEASAIRIDKDYIVFRVNGEYETADETITQE